MASVLQMEKHLHRKLGLTEDWVAGVNSSNCPGNQAGKMFSEIYGLLKFQCPQISSLAVPCLSEEGRQREIQGQGGVCFPEPPFNGLQQLSPPSRYCYSFIGPSPFIIHSRPHTVPAVTLQTQQQQHKFPGFCTSRGTRHIPWSGEGL